MPERPTARGGGDVTGDATTTDSTGTGETDDDLPEFEDDELRFDDDEVAAGPPPESDFAERETEQAPEPVPETAERRDGRLQAPRGRGARQPAAEPGVQDRATAQDAQRGRDAAAAGAGAAGQAGPPGRRREGSATSRRAAEVPRREDALLPPSEGGVEPEPVSREVGREPPAEISEGPPGAPELEVDDAEEAAAEVGAEATTVAEEVASEFEPFVVEAATNTITSGASIRQQQLRNRRRIREGDFGFDLVGEIRETAEEIEQTLFGGAREDFEEFEETFFEPVQEAAPTTADIRKGAFTFGEFALETSVGDENIFTFQFEEGEEPETADLTVFTGPGQVAAFGGTSAVSSARGFIQAARGTRAAQAARIGRTATTGPVGGGGGGFGFARGFPALNLGRDAQIGSGLLGLMAGAAIARERGIPEDAEPTGPEGVEVPEDAEPTGPEGFDVPEGVEPVAPVEFESPASTGDVFGPEVGVPEDAEPVSGTELDVPDRDRDTLEIGAEPFLVGEELEEEEEDDELGVPEDPFRRSDERLFDPAREFEEMERPLADVDPTEPGPGEAAEDIAEGLAGVGAPEVAGEDDITFAENMERAVEKALERQERAQQVDVLQDDDVAGEEEDLDVVAEEMERLEQAARARLDEDVAADELLGPDERAGELFGTGVDEAQLPREDQEPDFDVPERLGDRLRFDPDLAETPGQGQTDDFLEPPENPPEFEFPEVTPTSTGAPFEPVNPTETVTEDAPGLGLFEPVTQQFGEEPVDLLDLPEPRDEEEEFFKPVGTLDLFANPVLTGAELFDFGADDGVDDTSE